MRVRALKAAPDTAGLYFLMKGFALHPFGEGGTGDFPAKLQFENFSHTKKGAFTVEDSLVGTDTNQETSEIEEISIASPDRAAVKKSKRMTLSCPFQ